MKRQKMTRIISFRVTEEDWLKIERAAADCGDKPHDWCRTIALETLTMPVGLTPSQRILFGQMARAGWLVENGFQLLADDTLESEHWKDTALTLEQTSMKLPIKLLKNCVESNVVSVELHRP